MIEHNHYNTYSSAKYSNKNRTMYLALNRRGQPRKVLLKTIPGQHFLGKMATYTRVLTKPVLPQRVDELEAELLRALRQSSNPLDATEQSTQHPIRHHGSHQLICPPMGTGADERTIHGNKNGKFGCRKRRKRKKKKRRKLTDRDESDSVPKHRKHCSKNNSSNISSNNNNEENPNDKSKEETETTTISEIDSSTNISRKSATNHNVDTGVNKKQKTNQNSKNSNNNHKANKTFVFQFNGVPMTDCDAFRNVNKHRKCEEALQRQKAKAANFHLGEVDGSMQRDGKQAKRPTVNVAPTTNRQNRQQNVEQTKMCKHNHVHVTSTATTMAPITVESVFGDALVSSSPKYTVNTVDDTIGDSDMDDWSVTASFDDGADMSDATSMAVFMFANHKVPQTPVPPPYNELDEFDEDETSSVLDD